MATTATTVTTVPQQAAAAAVATTTDYFDSDHCCVEPIGLLLEFLSFGTLPRLDMETVQL